MYTLKIDSNLANVNAHINDINYKNILNEARTCIGTDSYPYELDKLEIHISTRYLKAQIMLKDIKIGKILYQKNIDLESMKKDFLKSKGERKISFLSFISKPFDSIIGKILNKKLAEQYTSIHDELLEKLNQFTKQLEQKISETGIDLKITDIQIN